jgi:hypothetical protein
LMRDSGTYSKEATMCEAQDERPCSDTKTIPVQEAVGTVLAHDITEIRPGEFKGCAFKKGHIIKEEDVCRLQRLGKEHLYVLDIADDEMHEDDAALAIATALMGEGVEIKGGPKEGKISLTAGGDGLLKVDREALMEFNMLGDVMCSTLHNNTLVKKGQTVAGTRAIPLVVKKNVVGKAVRIAEEAKCTPSRLGRSGGRGQGAGGVIQVKEMRRPRAGIVITGNEVYYGRVKDAFASVITEKIRSLHGEVVGIYYAPDDKAFIGKRLRELIETGADLLITTGGMSVDPDDVTRFAIRSLGAEEITYGSAVLPGAMFLVAYIRAEEQKSGRAEVEDSETSGLIPILGIPACGMYARTTVFDLVLPRVLAGEKIGRRELAELGHGGLCMKCEVCRYPVCPFGKC